MPGSGLPAQTGPVFFWGPYDQPYGVLDQWYPATMTAPLLVLAPAATATATAAEAHRHQEGERRVYTFNTSEQYMMAHKAYLFNPVDSGGGGGTHEQQQQQQRVNILDMILNEPDPFLQKMLGRKVPNFDEQLWEVHRYAIVKSGNYLKFTQNEALKKILLQTGDRELVEASPVDRIWGIGFSAEKAMENRHRWGLNLLGKVLMEVRGIIRREDEAAEKGVGVSE